WSALPPFYVDKAQRRIRAVIPNEDGRYDEVSLNESKRMLLVSVENASTLRQQDISRISKHILSMFRMEESFDEFYAETKKHPRYRWISKKHAGRLLRCPTVFEDVVKMICTTNCSWALTE